MNNPALQLEEMEVAKNDVFVTNEKHEQVQLFGAMADDYLRIQENMKSGKFNPGDLDMMSKIMQFANMPTEWRKFPEPVKKQVTEVREKVAQLVNSPKKTTAEEADEKERKEIESLMDNAAREAGMNINDYDQLLALFGIGYTMKESGTFVVNKGINKEPHFINKQKKGESRLQEAIHLIKKYNFKTEGDHFSVSGLDLSRFGHDIRLPKLHVKGDLNLSNTHILSFPKNLYVDGNLTLSGSDIQSISEGLFVGRDLDISNCDDLQQIGLNANVGGDLTCYNCPSLLAFPGKKQYFHIKGKIIGDEVAYYIAKTLGLAEPEKKSIFGGKDKGKPVSGYKYTYYKGPSKEENIMNEGISGDVDELSRPSKDYELIPKNLRK